MPTVLKIVYASAPTDEMLIVTVEIQIAGLEPIRVAHGFKDRMLGVNGEMVFFEQGALTIARPSKNATSGNQKLTFGVSDMTGRVQRYVDQALASGVPAKLIFREYLESDISEPASRPYVMDISGGQFEGGVVQIEASYYDLLNAAWPRERYNQINAPGIRYL